MTIGQEFKVFGNWFIIHFTENNGMAFGLEFAGEYGKISLTLFRIIAVGFLFYYLFKLQKKPQHPMLLTSLSLILAGALGNIIDSVFYGIFFNDSFTQVASFLPENGGYAPLFYGRVVDMLYFPIVYGYFPEWFPIWAGEEFLFFRPVFNIADSAISVGMGLFILFQNKISKFEKEHKKNESLTEENH
jgi:signal peptidase II